MSWTDGWGLGMSVWRNGLALQQTMIAGAKVIGHRQKIIAEALRTPLEADVIELNRMVAEKVVAFSQAGTSAWRDWLALQADCLALGQDIAKLALSASPTGAATIPGRAIALAEATSRAGGRALAPIHAAATANARRLGKSGRGRRN